MIPAHVVVPGTERHGVSILARQLAHDLGAEVVAPDDRGTGPVHLHLTDRLLGGPPGAVAAYVRRLAARRPTTVTLHDVPQPTDGRAFPRRRECYAGVLGAVAGWATSSATERDTLARHCRPRTEGTVVPLPVVPHPVAAPATHGPPSIGVFGWVYPGKGHREALEAAVHLDGVRVVGLGAVADGHADLGRSLAARAAELGVELELTGWLPDDEVAVRLAGVTVPLVAHGNLSASGSLNSWLAAGRRPLVRDSAYAREMAALRPGTVETFPADAGPDDLAARVAARLAEPAAGVVDVRRLAPLLADTAAAYRAWWERR